jgi:hypothetical protein
MHPLLSLARIFASLICICRYPRPIKTKARPEGFVASFRNPDPGANKLPEFIGISSPGKSGSGTTVKKDLTAQHEWALNRPVSSSALEFEPKGTIKLSNGTEYNIGEVRIEKTSLMVPARSETAYPANNTYEVPTYVHVAAGPGDAWKKAFAVEQNHLQNLAPGSPVLYEGMPLVLSKSEGSISGIFRGDYFNNGSCSFVSDGTGFIDVTASSTGIGLYKYIGEDTALGAYAAGKLNVSNKAYQFLGVKGQARVLDAPMAKLIDKAYPSLASQAKTSLKDGAQEYAAYVLSPQADMLQVNGDYLVPENAVGKLSVASKISQASVDDFRQASGLSGDITQDMQKDGKFYKVSLATTDFHPQDTLSQSFFMAKVDSDKKEGIINRSSISGRDTGVFFADKKLQNEIDKPAGAGSNANGAGASEMKSKKLATRADVLSLDQNTALFTGGSLRLNFPLNGGAVSVDLRNADLTVPAGEKLVGIRENFYDTSHKVKEVFYREYTDGTLKFDDKGEPTNRSQRYIKESLPEIITYSGAPSSLVEALNDPSSKILGMTKNRELVVEVVNSIEEINTLSGKPMKVEQRSQKVIGKDGVTPLKTHTSVLKLDGTIDRGNVSWHEDVLDFVKPPVDYLAGGLAGWFANSNAAFAKVSGWVGAQDAQKEYEGRAQDWWRTRNYLSQKAVIDNEGLTDFVAIDKNKVSDKYRFFASNDPGAELSLGISTVTSAAVFASLANLAAASFGEAAIGTVAKEAAPSVGARLAAKVGIENQAGAAVVKALGRHPAGGC